MICSISELREELKRVGIKIREEQGIWAQDEELGRFRVEMGVDSSS